MSTTPDSAALIRRLAGRDRFVASLGIEIIEAGPGTSHLACPVAEHHINFNGTCHGGVIFTLADTAFGLAANSRGPVAIGIDTHLTFARPVRAGDRLAARAVEVTRSRRLGTYRVDVTRGDGMQVAAFTGTVLLTGEDHPAED
ncbi:MAG: hotdog fold thioesterase [Pseudomonadota bacterium]